MNQLRINFLFIVFVFFFHFSLGQVGVPCETPDQVYGICMNIKECDHLVNLLRTQSNDAKVRNFLRSSICGYTRSNIPIVCCPQERTTSSNPIFTPPQFRSTTETPNGIGDNVQNKNILRKPDCGFSNITNSRVVGGVPVKLGEFPWMVALGYRNSKNPNVPKWLCGASLITDRHVLTAGHCVHGRSDLYLARIGDLDLYSDDDNANPENIALSSATIHEDYNPTTFTNDIAILTLSKRVTNPTVWPVCLPVDEPLRSRNFVRYLPVVAGWGNIHFNGPSSSYLQEAAIPVVTNQQCKQSYGTQATIDDRVLCAGYAKGGKDACKGDSGGPLMHIDSEANNLRITQIGVVSYGFKCAEPGYPGVYTRITNYIDWIGRNLN